MAIQTLRPHTDWSSKKILPLPRTSAKDPPLVTVVPAEWFGMRTEHGWLERCTKLVAAAIRIDVNSANMIANLAFDPELNRVRRLFQTPGRNADAFAACLALENKCERLIRTAMHMEHGPDLPPIDPDAGFVETRPARVKHTRAQVEEVVQRWVEWRFNCYITAAGDVWYALRGGTVAGMTAPPADREVLTQEYYTVRQILLERGIVPTDLPRSDLLRKLDPAFPEDGDKPVLVDEATAAEQQAAAAKAALDDLMARIAEAEDRLGTLAAPVAGSAQNLGEISAPPGPVEHSETPAEVSAAPVLPPVPLAEILRQIADTEAQIAAMDADLAAVKAAQAEADARVASAKKPNRSKVTSLPAR